MQLTQLALTNFRNFVELDLRFPAGPILLHGPNAQGKTNLLEAIYYLATSKSPHAGNDRQLLNWYSEDIGGGLAVGRLTGQVKLARQHAHRRLEIRIIREAATNGSAMRRETLVNGAKVRRMDLLGNLNAVLFLPQDVSLITSAPADRRRYLDIALCQVDRHYCRSLSVYNRVLLQRNALLRTIQEKRGRTDELDPWDQRLAELGARVLHGRARLVTELDRRAGQIHFDELTNGTESLRLVYQPRLLPNGGLPGCPTPAAALDDPSGWLLTEPLAAVAAVLLQVLHFSRRLELQRGQSLTGPHRDDLRFYVNGRELGDYGSRGQQRTAVLALKLAEIAWMESQTGELPVLLLDEVLAELDQQRRATLLRSINAAEQSFLTATDPAMFSHEFLSAATCLYVSAGTAKPQTPITAADPAPRGTTVVEPTVDQPGSCSDATL
jgi:DNA replication and repair protein RecF